MTARRSHSDSGASSVARFRSASPAASGLPVPGVRERVSDAEWAVRVELAAAYRGVAHFGWDDLVFTHLSARVPGEPHFLINPYGLLFDEVTASNLVKIDVEGHAVMDSPYPVNRAGFVIHSAVHMAREDAHCVMHLHTVAGQAVSAQKDGLLPLTQTAMLVRDDLATHAYEGVAVNLEERERLVCDLGDRNLMLLHNHGTLAVGPDVPSAFLRLYFLERACEAQVAAQAGVAGLVEPPAGTPEATGALGRAGLPHVGRELVWPALLRRLDRLDDSYRL